MKKSKKSLKELKRIREFFTMLKNPVFFLIMLTLFMGSVFDFYLDFNDYTAPFYFEDDSYRSEFAGNNLGFFCSLSLIVLPLLIYSIVTKYDELRKLELKDYRTYLFWLLIFGLIGWMIWVISISVLFIL